MHLRPFSEYDRKPYPPQLLYDETLQLAPPAPCVKHFVEGDRPLRVPRFEKALPVVLAFAVIVTGCAKVEVPRSDCGINRRRRSRFIKS
jgi:hypothetical protein